MKQDKQKKQVNQSNQKKQINQGRQLKKGKQDMLYWAAFAAVLVLIAFLCFYRLDAKYVDPYDEARHGVNAYEMLREGRLAESTYRYETDYYNLKPPLSMWCIMLSFVLLGKNVLALRVYSAVCYLLLAVCCGCFVRRQYGRTESILAMCFLAVNTAPFQAHMIRAGDADSLYVLLFTLAMLCMMELPERPQRLWLCGLFFALAFLAKSFHACLIVVIGGLYLLLTGELTRLKGRQVLSFMLAAAVPLGLWAVLRIRVDGLQFFRQMLYVDVLGRTSGALDNNRQPFMWYAQYFFGTMSGRLTVYLWALVICIVGAVYYSQLFTRDGFRKVAGYLLWAFVPFFAFSAVTNKLIWYLYPATIPLLLCAGILSGRLLKERKLANTVRIAAGCALLVLFSVYVRAQLQTIRSQGGNEFQQLITQAAREYGGRVQSACLSVSEGADGDEAGSEEWAQQDVYLAEVYGDWRCDDGGAKAFIEGRADILFASREAADRIEEELKAGREAGRTGDAVQRALESEHYVVLIRGASDGS